MLSDSQIHRLMDIANAGSHTGQIAQARLIYDGILSERPGFAPACIGRAFSHITVNDFDTAEAILRETVLSAEPDDGDGLAMLGLCLTLAQKKTEAEEVLNRLLARGGAITDLAEHLLDYLRR